MFVSIQLFDVVLKSVHVCLISGLTCPTEMTTALPEHVPVYFTDLEAPVLDKIDVVCPADETEHVWRCGTYIGDLTITAGTECK